MARVSQRVPKASISFYSVFHLFSLTTSVCLFLERYKYAPGDVRYLRENEELEQIITLSPNTTIFSGKLYSWTCLGILLTPEL